MMIGILLALVKRRGRATCTRWRCGGRSRRSIGRRRDPRPLPARWRRSARPSAEWRDGDDAAALAQFLHALGDQLFLDRREVKLLDQLGDGVLVGLGDLGEDVLGIFVAGLHAFEVDHAEAAELGHLDAEAHVGDAVHRAGDDRDLELERFPAAGARDFERGVDLVRVDGDFTGHQRDFIETVGDPGLAITSDPHSHTGRIAGCALPNISPARKAPQAKKPHKPE
jgi:hypothetical protein